MANVLPRETLKAVRRSYRSRFVLVGSLIAIVSGAFALLSLLPVYAIVKAEQEHTSVEVAALSPSDERDEIMRTQALVKALKPVAVVATSSLVILNEVFSARPPGIVLSSAGYVKGALGTIAVSGRASSRESINTFRATLSQNPLFESVTVPIGAFVGAGASEFSMTITGDF